LHVERRRKGERGELTITKTIWKAPLVKSIARCAIRKRHDRTRSRSNLGLRLTRAGVAAAFGLWEVSWVFTIACGPRVLGGPLKIQIRESVKMVHRPYSEATSERERLGRSWQRQIKLATSGYGRSASSALKRRPVSGAPGKSLAEAGAGEQRRFSLSFYLAKGWRRIEQPGGTQGACIIHIGVWSARQSKGQLWKAGTST